ncbi:MAG: M48 family metallopeptidase [Lachnospiraceae bacterium]|nr:M48 family metallopeptidase [Lachnospiraceae bacterium]MBQ3974247.1 M48 family metallopeptidase [Lachnospiraceae bacterium]
MSRSQNGFRVFIKRSARKSLSLEIMPDGSLLARAPQRMPEREIWAFIREKEDWIRVHREQRMERAADAAADPLSPDQIKELADVALRVLPERCRYFAGIMGVSYGRITIRNQKTRWGSCSSKGNLNFNCLLMLAPPEIRDYVVVHELAHRKEMNHSPRFWKEVEKVLPDYRQRLLWLKKNGPELIARMQEGMTADWS